MSLPPPNAQPPNSYVAWDGNTYHGNPPEGWYLAADGRWWSPGTGPGPAQQAPQQYAPPPPAQMYQQPPRKRRWFEKKRFTLPIAGVAALIVVGIIAGTQDDQGDGTTEAATSTEEADDATVEESTTTTAAETAEPVPGGGEEAEDFVSCTNIDGESYTIEVVNQSPKTSSYFMTIVLFDENGARVGDTFEAIESLRPNERLIEERFALVDFTFADCGLLELERFAAESDPAEMAEVSCTIEGADVLDDIDGTVTATNNTPEDSDYGITLAFVDAEGIRRGTASAFIERVRPGETAPTQLFTTTDYDPSLTCEVAGADRMASGT